MLTVALTIYGDVLILCIGLIMNIWATNLRGHVTTKSEI